MATNNSGSQARTSNNLTFSEPVRETMNSNTTDFQFRNTLNPYPSMNTPRDPLSSANTITAASSRLDFNDTPEVSPERKSTSSEQDIRKTTTIHPSYSNSPTIISQSNSPSWINACLNLRHVEIIVLISCFITGLTDVAMFANYSTFVSMQTGNTIFIALGASHQNTHPFIWVRCLFSLIAYSLGCFLFSRLHDRFLAPKTRRATLITTYMLQAILTIISAAIIQSGIVGRYAPGQLKTPQQQWDSLAPICLLSLGASGQIVAARALGIPDVPTVVVTSMLCELWSDPGLFFKRNPGRDRRALGFVLMLVGAIVGGWVDKVSDTTQAALWFAAGLKMVCVVAVAFWRSDKDITELEEKNNGV